MARRSPRIDRVYRRNPPSIHPPRMRQLLQELRLCTNLKSSCFRLERSRSARWPALHNVRAAHCGAEMRAEATLTTAPFAQLFRYLASRQFDDGLPCEPALRRRAHLGANKKAATGRGREKL